MIKISEVKHINVPKYPELAIKNIYHLVTENVQASKFFPNSYPEGRHPDRDYTYNILNSLFPDLVGKVVSHAHNQRNAVMEGANHRDEIKCSSQWE